MGLGIRGWRRVGLGLCKVGGVGSRSPWILCSAVRTISKSCLIAFKGDPLVKVAFQGLNITLLVSPQPADMKNIPRKEC